MPTDEEIGFPRATDDERELLLRWLGFLRGAVIRKADGLTEDEARWTPEGKLLPLLGIVNHLTNVERRWIDDAMLGRARRDDVVKRPDEYSPGSALTVAAAVRAYRARAAQTDAAVRAMPITTPCTWGDGMDLRFVLLHLVNETARHAGHADATRELLDGTTGE